MLDQFKMGQGTMAESDVGKAQARAQCCHSGLGVMYCFWHPAQQKPGSRYQNPQQDFINNLSGRTRFVHFLFVLFLDYDFL